MNAISLTSGGTDLKSTDLHANNKTANDTANSGNRIDKQEKQLQHNEIGNVTTGTGGKSGGKHTGDKKTSFNFDEKLKIEPDWEVTELLGSVITHNCPGTRTSARVIQKMKQDQTRPVTPPTSEREHNKKEEKAVQKTSSQVRANKPTWTNLERNHFFDALNEFGKDFESIGNYINSKLKRKCSTDVSFKTKDQVRQHYFQTYHKICKYIKFSDEVKKPAQELYALINYGEMRRKLQFVTDKHFMKLRNLVYQGHIIVRCKGKNIRIKTPSCKALRRLNQLDDSLEDIRLPSKIEVMVSPANLEAFGRVQAIAQNPRARTTVPLHKKLVNFIKTFQYKWRSSDMKLAEEEAKLFPMALSIAAEANSTQITPDPTINTAAANEKQAASVTPAYQDAEMCFLPKPNVTIHRPLLSITEYLSSVNICLTAYEERMGVKVRGETLSQERPLSKRQRTESGSEKRSPDTKKQKQNNHSSGQENKVDTELNSTQNITATSANTNVIIMKEESVAPQESESIIQKSENSTDELNDEINELLSDTDNLIKDELATATTNSTSYTTVSKTTVTIECFKIETPIIASTTSTLCSTTTSTSVSNPPRTKRGSGGSGSSTNTRNSRPALTFKPLISDDAIKRIRKGWTVSSAADITVGDLYVVLGQDSKLELEYYWTDGRPPACTKITNTDAKAATSSSLPEPISSSIFAQRQNGMPYNPSECNDPNLLNTLSTSSVANKLKHLLLIANLSERIRKRQCSCGHTCERIVAKTRIERDLAAKTFVSNKTFTSNSGTDGSGLFRQPMPIRRPIFNMDPVKQLSTLTRQKLSRQVLVQRLLLPGRANHSYDLLDVKNLQNNIAEFHHNESHNAKVLTASTVAVQVTSAATAITTTTPSLATSNSTLMNACNAPLSYGSEVSAHPDNYRNFTQTGTSSAFALPKMQYFGSSSSSYSNTQSQLNNVTNETTEELSLPSSSSLPDSAFDDCSNTSLFNGMSPMHLLRDSTSNSRWLEENLNDFSLTSLLGHLDEINSSRDILDPSSNLSVISESSVDYMHKFQEITALMQSQDKD